MTDKLLVLNVSKYDGKGWRDDYSWVVPFPEGQAQLKTVMRSWMQQLRQFADIDFNPLWEVRVEEYIFALALTRDLEPYDFIEAMKTHYKVVDNMYSPGLAFYRGSVELDPNKPVTVL